MTDIYGAGAPARILIAEDDPQMREVLVDCLTHYGYESVGVENGDDLERELLTGAYDLVISDIVMTGKSCQEIYRAHLSDDRRIPFIMISGHLPPRECPLSIGGEENMLYLLAKPFNLRAFSDLVSRALGAMADK